ncbi:MAG TPA: ATP-binding protein [Burkholderiaceae bacterium]|nr:ATP-binding protein [Burkholderiaceae bacterium]
MTARVMMALAILLLQALIHALGQQVSVWVLGVCGGYLAAALAVRVLARPEPPERHTGPQWLLTIGVDLVAFSALQLLQSGNMNYAPLFGLPLLLASVLGSRMLALGTAAGITLLLLGEAWWTTLQIPTDPAARFLQAGLTGTGYFIVAFLANQLATRLAREEQLARRSESAARLQMQVSELVIETLSDGVLVVDAHGTARASNPAARLLLGSRATSGNPFALTSETAWWPLLDLARSTLGQGRPQTADISIHHDGHSPRRVRVRTRMTSSPQLDAGSLCVMFLHDLREMEARLRTEKLAAMGRMSAAVAHEIRNPLAAIVQANALLDEDLHDPAHKRLALIVRQNAQRLAKIAEEVLDISRVQHQFSAAPATSLPLDETVEAVCRDWGSQSGNRQHLHLALLAAETRVEFEADHLRRVLVNLLDNARRYISKHTDSLQVSTGISASGQVALQVWSDGQPLEKSVEQHLFEPFFSSESRSTGLGLYICRELCARHGAAIGYQRALRDTQRGVLEGNAFFVTFRATDAASAAQQPIDTIVV